MGAVSAPSRFRASTARGGWSDADMLRLLQMTDAGLSAAQIASALGRSRSSCLGMLKRIRDDFEASNV